jgi:hypothetical protein
MSERHVRGPPRRHSPTVRYPDTGHRSTACCNRYPSLLATSTTHDCGPSSRSPDRPIRPGSPIRPARGKNSAVKPRSTRRGRAMCTSESLPSSKVRHTAGRSIARSRTGSSCAISIHVTASPGSSSRGCGPTPCTVRLVTRGARSASTVASQDRTGPLNTEYLQHRLTRYRATEKSDLWRLSHL